MLYIIYNDDSLYAYKHVQLALEWNKMSRYIDLCFINI